MSNVNYPSADNHDAIDTADGSRIAAVQVGAAKGVTLEPGVYVFPIDTEAGCDHIHLWWDEDLAGTFTFETSSFTETGRVDGADDVTDHSLEIGEWVPENPPVPAGNIPIVGDDNTVANMTITAGGTNIGAASVHIGNIGSRRLRVKADISTGGRVRVGANGRGGK